MSCLCVAPLPLRKNCRATAWRMIVFTSAPAGLFVERAHFTGDSVVLQRYFEITSYQDILPLKKTKKNLLLSIWPLTPTHASGLFSKPFWLYLRISWDHFSSGCVSLVWTPLLAVLHQLRVCVCVDCIAECVHDVRRAKSYSHVCGTHSRSFSHHRRLTFVRERRGTSSTQNVEK